MANTHSNQTGIGKTRLKSKLDQWQIPIGLGFGVIAAIQWYHLNYPSPVDSTKVPKEPLTGVSNELTSAEKNLATFRQVRNHANIHVQ